MIMCAVVLTYVAFDDNVCGNRAVFSYDNVGIFHI